MLSEIDGYPGHGAGQAEQLTDQEVAREIRRHELLELAYQAAGAHLAESSEHALAMTEVCIGHIADYLDVFGPDDGFRDEILTVIEKGKIAAQLSSENKALRREAAELQRLLDLMSPHVTMR